MTEETHHYKGLRWWVARNEHGAITHTFIGDHTRQAWMTFDFALTPKEVESHCDAYFIGKEEGYAQGQYDHRRELATLMRKFLALCDLSLPS